MSKKSIGGGSSKAPPPRADAAIDNTTMATRGTERDVGEQHEMSTTSGAATSSSASTLAASSGETPMKRHVALSPTHPIRIDDISPEMSLRSGKKKKRRRSPDGTLVEVDEDDHVMDTGEEVIEGAGATGSAAKVVTAKKKAKIGVTGTADAAMAAAEGRQGVNDASMTDTDAVVATVARVQKRVTNAVSSSTPSRRGRVALKLPSETTKAPTDTKRVSIAWKGGSNVGHGGLRLTHMTNSGKSSTTATTPSSSNAATAGSVLTASTPASAAGAHPVSTPLLNRQRLLFDSLSQMYATPIRPALMGYWERFRPMTPGIRLSTESVSQDSNEAVTEEYDSVTSSSVQKGELFSSKAVLTSSTGWAILFLIGFFVIPESFGFFGGRRRQGHHPQNLFFPTLDKSASIGRNGYNSLFNFLRLSHRLLEKPLPSSSNFPLDDNNKEAIFYSNGTSSDYLEASDMPLLAVDGEGGIKDHIQSEQVLLDELLLLQNDLGQNKAVLGDWEMKLSRAEEAVASLWRDGNGDHTSPANYRDSLVQNMILELSEVAPIGVATPFDDRLVHLPPITTNAKNCGRGGADDALLAAESETTSVVYIHKEDLERAKHEARLIVDERAASILEGHKEEEMAWLNAEFAQEVLHDGDVLTHGNGHGLSNEQVEAIIAHRLAMSSADSTGVIDYACIRQGGSIIRSKTSPSFVDQLPILNRVMAKLGLAFYGHPPDMALSVTYPKNALGQCWAFRDGPLIPAARNQYESQNRATNDGSFNNPLDARESMGRLASLSVRLAEPIKVTSVVVEHAIHGEGSNPNSAIQSFRVVGYEDEEGEGNPWYLGQFKYNNGGPLSMQEFTVKNDEGEIPLLRSVTLAIDSNWGFDYSCLYRFRVHGQS